MNVCLILCLMSYVLIQIRVVAMGVEVWNADGGPNVHNLLFNPQIQAFLLTESSF